MAEPRKQLPSAPLIFGTKEWVEEVHRLGAKSASRLRAEVARREIEAGVAMVWRPCEPESSDGTHLPGCRKVYVPLAAEGASAAPYGFVFRLVRTREGLAWAFLAYGERHPQNEASKSVYERAHKRLHGRYPS